MDTFNFTCKDLLLLLLLLSVIHHFGILRKVQRVSLFAVKPNKWSVESSETTFRNRSDTFESNWMTVLLVESRDRQAVERFALLSVVGRRDATTTTGKIHKYINCGVARSHTEETRVYWSSGPVLLPGNSLQVLSTRTFIWGDDAVEIRGRRGITGNASIRRILYSSAWNSSSIRIEFLLSVFIN